MNLWLYTAARSETGSCRWIVLFFFLLLFSRFTIVVHPLFFLSLSNRQMKKKNIRTIRRMNSRYAGLELNFVLCYAHNHRKKKQNTGSFEWANTLGKVLRIISYDNKNSVKRTCVKNENSCKMKMTLSWHEIQVSSLRCRDNTLN